MTQYTIDIGAAPDDGQVIRYVLLLVTPIKTLIKCLLQAQY